MPRGIVIALVLFAILIALLYLAFEFAGGSGDSPLSGRADHQNEVGTAARRHRDGAGHAAAEVAGESVTILGRETFLRVRMPDGSPAISARLWRETSPRARFTPAADTRAADAGGCFTLIDLELDRPEGRRLLVDAPGCRVAIVPVLESGSTTELALLSAASASFECVDLENRPVAGVEILLYRKALPLDDTSFLIACLNESLPAADGQFGVFRGRSDDKGRINVSLAGDGRYAFITAHPTMGRIPLRELVDIKGIDEVESAYPTGIETGAAPLRLLFQPMRAIVVTLDGKEPEIEHLRMPSPLAADTARMRLTEACLERQFPGALVRCCLLFREDERRLGSEGLVHSSVGFRDARNRILGFEVAWKRLGQIKSPTNLESSAGLLDLSRRRCRFEIRLADGSVVPDGSYLQLTGLARSARGSRSPRTLTTGREMRLEAGRYVVSASDAMGEVAGLPIEILVDGPTEEDIDEVRSFDMVLSADVGLLELGFDPPYENFAGECTVTIRNGEGKESRMGRIVERHHLLLRWGSAEVQLRLHRQPVITRSVEVDAGRITTLTIPIESLD